jgi:hypothetical protein
VGENTSARAMAGLYLGDLEPLRSATAGSWARSEDGYRLLGGGGLHYLTDRCPGQGIRLAMSPVRLEAPDGFEA